MSLRSLTKGLLESILRLAGGSPRRMKGRVLILAYHNVVPEGLEGRGDQSLHLPADRFRRQLDLLQEHCEIRPLAEVLDQNSASDRPRVAITFDDAYRGAVELALPELSRRGLPVTLFVAPGLFGADRMWWDELAVAGSGLSPRDRAEALGELAGNHELIRSRKFVTHASTLPPSYGCAGDAEVQAVSRLTGVTLGAHTWSHPNLARLSGEELRSELSRPLQWLRESGAPMLPVLAYPYGLHSPVVEAAAEQAGYLAALRVEGGWFAPPLKQRWTVPRFNIPAGLSEDGLLLRLAGWGRM